MAYAGTAGNHPKEKAHTACALWAEEDFATCEQEKVDVKVLCKRKKDQIFGPWIENWEQAPVKNDGNEKIMAQMAARYQSLKFQS